MNAGKNSGIFTLGRGNGDPLRRALFRMVARPLEHALALARLEADYRTVLGADDPVTFAEQALVLLSITPRVSNDDLRRIPTSGPLLVVCNHPFGAVEGLALAAVLGRRRPDLRLLANALLSRIPELRRLVPPVDLSGGAASSRANAAVLLKARSHVRGGGAVAVFPAGEVAHLRPGRWLVTDPPWQRGVARLVRGSDAAIVPVFFPGANGRLFQGAGLLHPRLRRALLPRELLNKHGRAIEMRVGPPIAAAVLERIEEDERIVDLLRVRTYALAERAPAGEQPITRGAGWPLRLLQPVAAAAPREALADEIAALPSERLLVTCGELEVWLADADQTPEVLREVGRQREISFRSVGEGTGRPLDLDRFDASYRHLILWDASAKAVAGAYRLGEADRLLAAAGPPGLYTSTLFAYDPGFFQRLCPAIELGRSFVAGEYQRSFGALLALWRGIGRFLSAQPQYRWLFGPVSISANYQPLSRELIASYLWSAHREPELERLTRPRTPNAARRQRHWERQLQATVGGGIDELGDIVADLEPDRKGVPVLLRQYLKLGARVAGFNRDPRFSNVWDCLLVVDLARTPDALLARVMGREGLASYRAHHAPAGNSTTHAA